jgi:hypothetical protein
LLLVAAGAGGWYFFSHYQIQGLDSVAVKPRGAMGGGPSPSVTGDASDLPPVPPGKDTIRIAAFHCGPLDQNKIGKPLVVERLSQVIRRFDIVALQDLRARNHAVIGQLVERVNGEGRQYHYALPPDAEQEKVHSFNAFVYDRATIEIDHGTLCLANDPGGRLRHPPLVAAFRARGPDPRTAFTFTLVNVHTDAERAATELDVLAEVFRAVRDDGRNEDDVILLGDLEVDERHLGQLGQVPGLTSAITGVPTTTRGTEQVDNILFDCRATREFTGRAGVMDLMRELNLSLPETLEMTSHLPVWAEFSVYEGGQRK